jgi:hypothetical protein
MTDTRIAALLDELTPTYDDRHGDWERVTADARSPRHRVTVPWARAAVLAGAVAAAAALVLAWPFGDQHGSVLDRALAAVGDGPVLHTVLRGEWGGTLVDLTSGRRTAVYGNDEVWFDTESGQVHSIRRLGGVVQEDWLGKPVKQTAVLAALGREYRHALESGTAHVAGDDTIDGEPVAWVTIHSELVPGPSGRITKWAQQVAVSQRTYKPVALRETRDGRPSRGMLQRVLELQMVARDPADFVTSRPSRVGTAFNRSRDEIRLEQASTVLGGTPLWVGHDHDGLPLTGVYRETIRAGHQERVRVTGAKAAAAIKCSHDAGTDEGDCFRGLGLRSPVEVRPGGVFTFERSIRWSDAQNSVVFVYGNVGDPSTYLKGGAPSPDKRYLTVTEGTRRPPPFRYGAGRYVPRAGSLFVAAGERTTGYLQRDGVQITIDTGSEAAVVAAARALTPVP